MQLSKGYSVLLKLTRSCSGLPGVQGGPVQSSAGLSNMQTVKVMIATHFQFAIMKPEVGWNYLHYLCALGSPVEACVVLLVSQEPAAASDEC